MDYNKAFKKLTRLSNFKHRRITDLIIKYVKNVLGYRNVDIKSVDVENRCVYFTKDSINEELYELKWSDLDAYERSINKSYIFNFLDYLYSGFSGHYITDRALIEYKFCLGFICTAECNKINSYIRQYAYEVINDYSHYEICTYTKLIFICSLYETTNPFKCVSIDGIHKFYKLKEDLKNKHCEVLDERRKSNK